MKRSTDSQQQERNDLACPVCTGRVGCPERKLNDYQLYRCSTCRMVFVWPRPTRDSSRESYTNGQEGEASVEASAVDNIALMRDYDLEHGEYVQHSLVRRLQRITLGHPVRRMLDFGCGSGHLLGLAKELLDCSTHGVEVHPVARTGAARFGFTLHQGSLQEMPSDACDFDLIYSEQVFEHLPEPRVELDLLRQLLVPGGLLYVEVPSYESISIRLGRDRFWYNNPPGHLNYFTRETLGQLFRESGFDIRSCRTTGLNYPALLGHDHPQESEATRVADSSDAAVAHESPIDPSNETAIDLLAPSNTGQLPLRGRIKLSLLSVLDDMLSVPGWGKQVEVLAVRRD